MRLPENILKAINILSGGGFEAFVVGGCVRDMIMGKVPDDYDITTNALPGQTVECFKDYKVIETGIKHGTVTVVIDGENIEITTYRVDGEYLDNRRPENVRFTGSLEEDLKRRDFTMNAIAYSPDKGIIDPLGGEQDIKNGLIRCVGDPDKRFNEDGLRILRALRFSSQTGVLIDGATDQSIRKNKDLIKNLSAERIFTELKKLLCGENAQGIIREYVDVIGVFIPEILPMVAFPQNTKYHCYDVFEHTLKALENSEKSEVIRLAVLLHDIGKPEAFTTDADGTAHFKGHAQIGAEMAKNIFARLKSDNDTKNMVCNLIAEHSIKISVNKTAVKKYISKKGLDFVKLLLKVKKADNSAKAPEYCNPAELDLAEKLIKEIEKSGFPLFISDLEVTGSDLIELGISGKKIGETLASLLELVIEGKLQNTKEVLTRKAKEMVRNEND
ncbi:MAG: HD domain-containing protein [Clostridia bacterium]|nr:HD domain-containing protein [Clostridia bacterium]